jgi:hypothetical protein
MQNTRQAKRVNSPFHLQGTMARAPYIAMSIALVLLQYFVQGVVFAVHYGSGSEFWNPWILLPMSITRLEIWFHPRWKNEQWLLIPVLLVHATLMWLLLAAAIRRARSTGQSLLVASMVPCERRRMLCCASENASIWRRRHDMRKGACPTGPCL